MTSSNFSQYNETDQLKKVIIGRWQNYAENPQYIELVNESQKRGLPDKDQLKSEISTFKAELEKLGVEVLIPRWVGPIVYDQLTPRDIGVVIGNTFLICPMMKSSRRFEVAGIFDFVNEMNGSGANILLPDEPDIFLEGGDILVNGGRIFVGISQRTNEKGVSFLQQHFSNDFDIVPIQCKKLQEGEDVLHLDCAINPVGEDYLLIYPEGLSEIPEVLRSEFQWLEVTKGEQQLLGTNVLSIDKATVIARKHPGLSRVNNMIRQCGIKVIEVKFDAPCSTGGSFRCGTLPLVRTPGKTPKSS